MGDFRFENVRVILAEPNVHLREGIRSRLFDEGFRNVVAAEKLAKVRTALGDPDTENDLLIADVDLPDGDSFILFAEIRHHLVGDNPFMPIIAMSAEPNRELVWKVINAGADTILGKPLTMDSLIARIRSLVKHRKPFVVTADYIGPDRRSRARPDSRIPLIEVPNPLRAKAMGIMGSAEIYEAVLATSRVVNEQRIERQAATVAGTVQGIGASYQEGTPISALRQELDRLLYITLDISHRMADTRYDHVAELCEALIGVVSSLIDADTIGEAPKAKDLKLLSELAEAIEGALELGEGAVQASRDISESVAHMSAH